MKSFTSGRLVALSILILASLQGCSSEDTATADSGQVDSTSPPQTRTTLDFPDPTVSYLQQALQTEGYSIGPIDGRLGPSTIDALTAFQTDHGLEATGHLDGDTILALENDNEEVDHLLIEAIQTQLTELGEYSGQIDGVWGPSGVDAVVSFQSTHGLPASGALDPATFQKLTEEYAVVATQHHQAASESGVGQPQQAVTDHTKTSEGGYLQAGDSSDEVQRIQVRLAELGYRPGTSDGNFGAHTTSAVLAFQKREGLERDGIVGPEVLSHLESPEGAGPQSPDQGPRVEVDLDRQILFVIDGSGHVTTLNTSTGSGKEFQSAEAGKGIVVAHTPVGKFEILRVIDGLREAPLGTLYRPMYFTNAGGFAIHGNPYVPGYPASHGCARLANYDMDFLWDTGLGVGNPVWVYGDNPDRPDNASGGF